MTAHLTTADLIGSLAVNFETANKLSMYGRAKTEMGGLCKERCEEDRRGGRLEEEDRRQRRVEKNSR